MNNARNSVLRGVTSEGYQQAADGFYNLLGNTVGHNPYSDSSTQDIRDQLEDAEKDLAVEQAAIRARLERQRRGFVPPPSYGQLRSKVSALKDELNFRQGNGESFLHATRGFLESTQAEASRQRQAVRNALPVDQKFAESAPGKILQGIGGLSMLPLYGTPLGPAATVSQVYQQGFDDYVLARERQGLPVNMEEADLAAKTFLLTAGPAEVVLNNLMIGKILKGSVGKATVGELRKRLGIVAVTGGFTNAGQQAWLNIIASHLQRYDPDRPVTKEVLESAIYGVILSSIGGAAGHYFNRGDNTPPGKFDPERKRDWRKQRGIAIVPSSWGRPRPGRFQAPDDRGGASQPSPGDGEPSKTTDSNTKSTADGDTKVALAALQKEREELLAEIEAAKTQGYDASDLQILNDWIGKLDQKILELSPADNETSKNSNKSNKTPDLPEIGKSFNSQRRKIPKAGGNIIPILLRSKKEIWVDRVTKWLDAVKEVQDPNGKTILLANPEDGSLANRALHLIGSYREDDIYKQSERILASDKARTVFSIPKTIEDYQVLAEDGNHGLAYFRRYADGTLHMVIVEEATGKLKDHALIAQRQIDNKDGAEGFTIVEVRNAAQ